MKLKNLINVEKCKYIWKNIQGIEEFAVLKDCEQSPKWHKEGNVDKHVEMVCNEAIKVAKECYWEEETRLIFLAAALFHDIGKGTTTKLGKDGNWHSYGHDFEGERLTRLLLWDEDIWIRERICALVRNHMEIEFIPEHHDFLPKLISMSKAVKDLDMLIKLKECDLRGSIQDDEELRDIELLKLQDIRDTAQRLGFLNHPAGIPNKYPWQKALNEKKMGKTVTVIVPIGLSGAGKSTWVMERFPDAAIISRDTIREELGYTKPGQKAVLSREQEDKVSSLFNQRLIKAVRDGNKPIVLDNLNLKKKYRDAYKSLLSSYSINWVYVYVEALGGLETNLERRKEDLDIDVLKNMVKALDWPVDEEYDKFGIFTNGEKRVDYSDFDYEGAAETITTLVD